MQTSYNVLKYIYLHLLYILETNLQFFFDFF